jgi:phosphatidylserine/phosphatidylglycerophosphate/cardiolipin synthase-like enzyme
MNNDNSLVYCTSSYRSLLPNDLKSYFRDLDQLILSVAESAIERLLIVSPFMGSKNIEVFKRAIAVSAENGARIIVVTLGPDQYKANAKSLELIIQGENGLIIKPKLRVLSGTINALSMLHAKLIIADGKDGYLGSANLSGSGLDDNLEVGVRLDSIQSKAFDELVKNFESKGILRQLLL